MEKVIYRNKGGLGLILEQKEIESDYFKPKDFIINGELIRTGVMTDLFGMFLEPVRYSGVLIDDENCMCFFLGTSADLFKMEKFFSCFYWISETRIANKYSEGTVRDFNFINGIWR